jgi:hypothetical protein
MRLLTIVFILFVLPLHAQVTESYKNMSEGEYNSFSINFDMVGIDTVKKEWTSFLDSKSPKKKTKYFKYILEYFTEQAEFKNICDHTNVYSKFEKDNNRVTLTSWYYLGGKFLSSKDHPAKVKLLKEMLVNFSEKVLTKYISNNTLTTYQNRVIDQQINISSYQQIQDSIDFVLKTNSSNIKSWKDELVLNIERQKDLTAEIAGHKKAKKTINATNAETELAKVKMKEKTLLSSIDSKQSENSYLSKRSLENKTTINEAQKRLDNCKLLCSNIEKILNKE